MIYIFLLVFDVHLIMRIFMYFDIYEMYSVSICPLLYSDINCIAFLLA